jgi:hypothetical protein
MDNNHPRGEIYFAAKDSKDTAVVLLDKAHNWFLSLDSNGYLNKIRTMWAAYHGAYFTDNDSAHTITFGGEQGELVQMSVNHLRNVARRIHTFITATRPSLQARASNADYKSLVQTKLANSLLDYYMREKRLEKYLNLAAEHAIVMGSGYIKMEWNAMSGEVYDYNEELDVDIREGDVQFVNLSPFDVVFDTNREDDRHDWVLCRSFKNRFDIAAKYPEFREEILRLPTKSQIENFTIDTFTFDQTDLIPIYEFYHKRTESMENGRYMLFLSGDVVLIDDNMPYRDLPVYKVCPANILGTAYGYTDLFDILPLQDVLNTLYSAAVTNNTAFAVQNILVPRGADVSMSELSGGLNIVEANTQYGEIKPLQLTATPAETFKLIEMLVKDIEIISGVNSVSRGNPDPQLRSGNALALIQSMTIQFMSGLQQSYVSFVEDIGTGLINILKDHASVPRVAAITGKSNYTYMKEFVGDDLSQVNRVVVDIGNPLAQTTAGRVEMAEQLLQMNMFKSPQEYITVVKTGQLDIMTEDTESQIYLVRGENERLVSGEPVIAVFTDDHLLHIKEHSVVLSDPELRFNPELVKRVSEHIQEHINLLRTTDPDTLRMLDQQPLGPQGGSPVGPQQEQMPSNQSMQGGQIQNVQGGEPVATQMDQMGIAMPENLPNIPTPPAPLENLPLTPQGNLPNIT